VKDLLPESVRHLIRDRYLAGVADAEAQFEFNKADEDSLTGGLGQAISMAEPLAHRINGETYIWQTYYRKIRGRGPSAPERTLGADGVFQIEVLDRQGKVLRRKGLPFQAKKNWSGRDGKLVGQIGDMLREAGQGIAIDYSPRGYTACTAEDVVTMDGRKSALQTAGRMRPLGQILGNDFLDCTIGRPGLFYDEATERFAAPRDVPPSIEHVLGTSVHKVE
jgi:hypothetical protein